MGAYSKILKQAYQITNQNRFLWIASLFLSASILAAALVINQSWKYYLTAIIVFILFQYSIRLFTAQIIAVKAILDKQETSFTKSFKAARLFFGRVFIILFFITLVLIIGSILLIYPFLGTTMMTTSLVFYFLLFALCSILAICSSLFIVVFDLNVREATSRSLQLSTKCWPALFGLFMLLLVMDLPALFLGGFVVGLRGGLIFSIAGGILFLLFQTWFFVFQQITWNLLFQDLIKPQKLAETTPGLAPEIV